MAKLRSVNTRYRIPLISLILLLITSALWYLTLIPKKYSSSPEEVIKNISISCRNDDYRSLASLFDNQKALKKFLNVPKKYLTHDLLPHSIWRSDGETGLKAWSRCLAAGSSFKVVPRNNPITGEPDPNFKAAVSTEGHEECGIGLKQNEKGWIIEGVGFSL